MIIRDYKLTEILGSGGFGEIWKGINSITNEQIAIKLEESNTRNPQLFYEGKLYSLFMCDSSVPEKGIPNVYDSGIEGEFNFLVMDLLGPSLEDLLDRCNRKFSLKTVLMLADQMITRIEYVHNKNYLHRDIKSNNFLIGINKNSHIIYIIDFGLAKRYIRLDGKHIPYDENKKFTGNGGFASINNHLKIEQSRRDDLESLGYVFVYFLNGFLPWQNLVAQKVLEKKIATSVENLCKGCPQEFTTYLNYCRNLKFEEKPDYGYLKSLFKNLMHKSGFEYDFKYDWTVGAKVNVKENENKVVQAIDTQKEMLGEINIINNFEEVKQEENNEDRNRNLLENIKVTKNLLILSIYLKKNFR